MSEKNESLNTGEKEDLRYLILKIFEYKWLIISVAIISALLAFLISRYLVTPRFSTSAYITLTKPIINAEFDPSIQVSPAMPDTQSLAELAQADSVIKQVIEQTDLEDYFIRSKVEMEASLRGKNQLLLSVSNEDPGIATELANSWSEVVVQKLNELYGTGEATLAENESELEKAQQEWLATQDLLERYLPQSQLNVISVELQQLIVSLRQYLITLDNNQAIILDAEVLNSRLSKENQEEGLSLGDALGLIALLQRTSGDITGTEIQLEGGTLFGDSFSVADAQKKVLTLITSIEEQNNAIQDEITEIKDNITRLFAEQEAEEHKIDELTQERDLARTTYLALANQRKEILITTNQAGNLAKVSAEAVEPTKPSSPSVLVNTFLGGFTGLLLSLSGVMIYYWWNFPKWEKS